MHSPASTEDAPPLTDSARRLAQRIFIICENRLQLLLVEAQEERERVLSAISMAMIIAVFGMLAGMAVTLLVAVAFWECHPAIALLVLSVIYVGVALFFYAKLMRLQRDWQSLPTTIEQLKKDRECLEKHLN